MDRQSARVQCQKCLVVSSVPEHAARFDCACGWSYYFRRCGSCQVISYVPSVLQRGEAWHCVWCRTANSGFSVKNDPAAATPADLVADMARQGLEFKQALPGIPDVAVKPILTVTMNEIPGYRITRVHGDVFGLTVRVRNYFGNLGAQFMTLVGGEVEGYTKLLSDSRRQARERMWHEAHQLGANAIVAMRFDCNEIGDIMSEVVAYGTAVTIEPDPATTP